MGVVEMVSSRRRRVVENGLDEQSIISSKHQELFPKEARVCPASNDAKTGRHLCSSESR